MQLITQRSLVQIQPAQPEELQVRGLIGGFPKRGAAKLLPKFPQAGRVGAPFPDGSASLAVGSGVQGMGYMSRPRRTIPTTNYRGSYLTFKGFRPSPILVEGSAATRP